MATKKRKTTKRKKKTFEKVITLIVAAIILICGYFTVDKIVEDKTPVYEVPDGVAQFHFIDVGQGDAELITVGTKAVLIDTGDKAGKDALIKYLDEHSEQLTPKTALELLKIAAPLMRISAGLPASSPLEELRTGNTSGVSVNIATDDTTKTEGGSGSARRSTAPRKTC